MTSPTVASAIADYIYAEIDAPGDRLNIAIIQSLADRGATTVGIALVELGAAYAQLLVQQFGETEAKARVNRLHAFGLIESAFRDDEE